MKPKRMPSAPGRRRVTSRWHTCSKLAPNCGAGGRCRSGRPAPPRRNGFVGQQHRTGDVRRQRAARAALRRRASRAASSRSSSASSASAQPSSAASRASSKRRVEPGAVSSSSSVRARGVEARGVVRGPGGARSVSAHALHLHRVAARAASRPAPARCPRCRGRPRGAGLRPPPRDAGNGCRARRRSRRPPRSASPNACVVCALSKKLASAPATSARRRLSSPTIARKRRRCAGSSSSPLSRISQAERMAVTLLSRSCTASPRNGSWFSRSDRALTAWLRSRQARCSATSARAHAGCCRGEVGGAARLGVQRASSGAAGELAQVVDQPALGRAVEFVDRHLELVGQPLQQRAADAAPVAFDQVQVRGRNAGALRQRALRHAERVAPVADLRADQGARHCCAR